jgi:hypothetical protein
MILSTDTPANSLTELEAIRFILNYRLLKAEADPFKR